MRLKPAISRRILVGSIMFIVILLLLVQYFHNRSLWLDEAMLGLNIVEKKPLELLRPLDYSQVAPILFLEVEKCFVLLFGNGERALRIFPLLCSIACLPLLLDFGKALSKNKMIPLLTLCLLACTPKFIYYASEVKQYASDIFVLCAIYFAAFSESAFVVRRRATVLAVTGAVSVFLSNISVVPLATVGLLFVFRILRNRKDLALYAMPLAIWGICIGVNYFVFVYHHPTAQVMKEYWKDSFMPLSHGQTFNWLGLKMDDIFHNLLPYPGLAGSISWLQPPHILGMLLFVCSLIYLLASRQFLFCYVCTAPILLHLALSALKIYPFDLRLVLYTIPLYLLVMASGLYLLSAVFVHFVRIPVLQYVVVGLLVLTFLWGPFKQYPYETEEIRPMISDINNNIQPGSTVYIYYGGQAAFRYYQETSVVRFDGSNILLGISHVDNRDGYLAQLAPVKGPTWLLFSHIYPFDGSRGEEQHILKGLEKRGTLQKQFQAYGSSAYLFDLK